MGGHCGWAKHGDRCHGDADDLALAADPRAAPIPVPRFHLTQAAITILEAAHVDLYRA
jgi:hypothetical protein